MAAALRHFGGRPVLAGHSMGAYIALLDASLDALSRLTKPTPLLTAPAGMFGAPPGLLAPELIATWQERVPALRPQLVPGVNH